MHLSSVGGGYTVQAPAVVPPIGQGDIVVTHAPHTTPPLPQGHIHVRLGVADRVVTECGQPSSPPLTSSLVDLFCADDGGNLSRLFALKFVSLENVLSLLGTQECPLTQVRIALSEVAACGDDHLICDRAAGFQLQIADILKQKQDGNEVLAISMAPMLNGIQELYRDIVLLLGAKVLEHRQQELQAADQPSVARGRGRGIDSRSVTASSRGRGHGGQRR